MALKEQLQSDVKDAMRSKDTDRCSVLRMVIAAINSKGLEKRYKIAKENPEMAEDQLTKESMLNDEESLSVVISEVKKRKDAIALYQQGGRQELVDKEQVEIDMLQKYLPEQLSAEDIKKYIQESIAATGATNVKDMGKVMADLSPKIKGKADAGEVGKMVKELLA